MTKEVMQPLQSHIMKIGGKYNWKDQQEKLIYAGKCGAWHEFRKIDDPHEIWCEVLDSDLCRLEETEQPKSAWHKEFLIPKDLI